MPDCTIAHYLSPTFVVIQDFSLPARLADSLVSHWLAVVVVSFYFAHQDGQGLEWWSGGD